MASADLPGVVTAGPATPQQATPASGPPSNPSAVTSLPPGLAELPFARHVAASGARLTDLGAAHGLRLIAARQGGEFRVYSLLPSGDGAVEGAPIDLSPAQMAMVAAGNVTELGRQGGFSGYFVRSGQSFQVFYATPDGQALVPGVLRDAQGKNITRGQVSDIPGAIPTVEVTSAAGAAPSAGSPAAQATASPPTATAATLAAVEASAYGTIGPEGAPRLFMLIDPQCIYSLRSYQQLRSFAAAGKIRLSVVPLSVLDYEDHGQSTRSALALLSKSADQILPAWQAGDVNGAATPEAAARLRQNMAIAEAIGLKGTPTFVWKKTDGTIGRIDGVPSDIGALLASAGG